MDIPAILSRQAHFESERSGFEALWDEVSRRLFPRGAGFGVKHSPGQARNLAQYDSFPMLALHRYAAAMVEGLTPRTKRWHRLSTGDEQIDEDPECKLYFEEMSNALWEQRYAPRANFAGQNDEVFMSAGAYGTGAIFTEAHPAGGLRYRFIPLQECFLSEDFSGRIDTFHRKFAMSVRNILRAFTRPGDVIPEKVQAKLTAGKLDEMFEVLHVVMPREDYQRGKLGKRGMPWTDIYIFCDTKELIRDSGYYEFPYAVNRHAISPGETYGRGPGLMLLPDVKMLNEMRRAVIEAAEMRVDPPVMLADDGILSEFRMVPGARNYGAVDQNGRAMAIPFDSRSDPGIGLDMIQDTRGQIDDAFLGVYFRVLLENPQMTATQALLIAQQQGQMVAPVVGRSQAEYLGPLIRRESGILYRQGKHPPMPAKLAEYLRGKGRDLGIEYESPMTRAVRSEDGVAVLRAFETLTPFAAALPEQDRARIFRKFDPDKVAELVAEVNGVPMSVLRSADEMAAIDQQEQMAAQAATILQAAPVAAETAKTLAQARREAASVPEVVR